MKSRKKSNTVKLGYPVKVVKMNLPDFDNDPFLIKKREQAIKTLTEAPLPDWLLKKMRGD